MNLICTDSSMVQTITTSSKLKDVINKKACASWYVPSVSCKYLLPVPNCLEFMGHFNNCMVFPNKQFFIRKLKPHTHLTVNGTTFSWKVSWKFKLLPWNHWLSILLGSQWWNHDFYSLELSVERKQSVETSYKKSIYQNLWATDIFVQESNRRFFN